MEAKQKQRKTSVAKNPCKTVKIFKKCLLYQVCDHICLKEQRTIGRELFSVILN